MNLAGGLCGMLVDCRVWISVSFKGILTLTRLNPSEELFNLITSCWMNIVGQPDLHWRCVDVYMFVFN